MNITNNKSDHEYFSKMTIPLHIYHEKLKNNIAGTKPSIPISLFKNNKTKERKMVEILGQGGDKIAIKMDNGKALLIPNYTTTLNQEGFWDKVVEGEIQFNRLLKDQALLCPKYSQATISKDGCTISAYVSESFEQLAEKKNIYVIDVNYLTNESSKKAFSIFKKCFFKFDEMQHWKKIFAPLTQDVAKLLSCGIPIPSDSFNWAVVTTENSCHVRYFGFDFCGKYKNEEIKPLHKDKIDWINIKARLENVYYQFSPYYSKFDSEEFIEWALKKVKEEIERN